MRWRIYSETLVAPADAASEEIPADGIEVVPASEVERLREALDGLIQASDGLQAGMYAGPATTKPEVRGDEVQRVRTALNKAREALNGKESP